MTNGTAHGAANGTDAPVVALVAIARPTFDVALAQSMAEAAVQRLEEAGCTVAGTRRELIMDGPGAERAAAALAARPADLLVLLQASFADSSMAVELAAAAHAQGRPVLLWAIPEPRTGGRLRLNSLCGINLAGHALAQRQIKFDYVLASPEHDSVAATVVRLARAGRARRLLGGARIGVVGQAPPGFDTCAYDAAALQRLFGVQVASMPLEEVLATARAAGGDVRQAFVQRAAAVAANLDELDGAAVAGTGGVYAALAAAAQAERWNGVAVRCWPEFFTELGCAACGAMSMLTQDRCPASCEADVNGTVTSLLLQALSGGPAWIADLVSIDPADDTGVLWHCGLAPAEMADPDAPIRGAVHSNRKLPLLFEFGLKPGRVTLCRLHYAGNGDYSLAVGGGEMVRAPKSFSGTSGVIRFDRPAADFFATLMDAGLEHHISLVYGDYCAELRAFAKLTGLPVLELT